VDLHDYAGQCVGLHDAFLDESGGCERRRLKDLEFHHDVGRGAGVAGGLLAELVQKPSLSSSSILQDDTYTWSQEPIAGNVIFPPKQP